MNFKILQVWRFSFPKSAYQATKRDYLSQPKHHIAMHNSASSDNIFAGKGAETLRQKSPGKCSTDTPLVPKEQLEEKLQAIPFWVLNAEQTQISRSFVAKNFLAALDFFNKVGELAEEANHHPDLHLTGYRNVEVVLSTHAIGGLAEPDFILAARIDALPVEYSPKWLKQIGK